MPLRVKRFPCKQKMWQLIAIKIPAQKLFTTQKVHKCRIFTAWQQKRRRRLIRFNSGIKIIIYSSPFLTHVERTATKTSRKIKSWSEIIPTITNRRGWSHGEAPCKGGGIGAPREPQVNPEIAEVLPAFFFFSFCRDPCHGRRLSHLAFFLSGRRCSDGPSPRTVDGNWWAHEH